MIGPPGPRSKTTAGRRRPGGGPAAARASGRSSAGPPAGPRSGGPVRIPRGPAAPQNTAIGSAGEPVPPTTGRGAATNMNSSRPSSTQARARGSTNALSTSARRTRRSPRAPPTTHRRQWVSGRCLSSHGPGRDWTMWRNRDRDHTWVSGHDLEITLSAVLITRSRCKPRPASSARSTRQRACACVASSRSLSAAPSGQRRTSFPTRARSPGGARCARRLAGDTRARHIPCLWVAHPRRPAYAQRKMDTPAQPCAGTLARAGSSAAPRGA
jgi:hypothetical protein